MEPPSNMSAIDTLVHGSCYYSSFVHWMWEGVEGREGTESLWFGNFLFVSKYCQLSMKKIFNVNVTMI